MQPSADMLQNRVLKEAGKFLFLFLFSARSSAAQGVDKVALLKDLCHNGDLSKPEL